MSDEIRLIVPHSSLRSFACQPRWPQRGDDLLQHGDVLAPVVPAGERLAAVRHAVVEVQQLLLERLGIRDVDALAPLSAALHPLDFDRGWEVLQEWRRELDTHAPGFADERQFLEVVA